MKQRILGCDLLKRWEKWDITNSDLVEILLIGSLTSYDPVDFTPLNIDEHIEDILKAEVGYYKEKLGLLSIAKQYRKEWLEGRRKEIKNELIQVLNHAVTGRSFKISEVEEYEKIYNLKLTERTEDALNTHLSTIGKKGGERSKIIQPIREALIIYLRDNETKLAGKTHEAIAKIFCRKFNSNRVITVNFEGYRWEIYCYDQRVYCRCDESLGKSKPKNDEKSIAFSTFRKTYIPLAKKHLSTP